MTGRLSEVEAHIGSVRQLSAVITAMRGIAAARVREARAHVEGIRAYTQTISAAIGESLALLPEMEMQATPRDGTRSHAIAALCAEQGFAGVFSERVLAAAGRLAGQASGQRAELLLVGDRGRMIAEERGLAIAWSAPMAVHAGQVPSLANRLVEALYERINAGEVTRVTVVHAAPGASAVTANGLVPFDFRRVPPARGATPPLITLPPRRLIGRLVEEYIFAEICQAMMLSFAAENEARMQAMIAARSNVAKTLDGLLATFRQLRQNEITNEIIELVSGVQAG